MLEILQDAQRLPEDPVRFAALDVDHEADAAGVALVSGIVQPLGGPRRVAAGEKAGG
jgi:hypothetical protein